MSRSEFSDLDRRHMEQALGLAARGKYTTTPNPCVGAVIVNNGVIVGQGWHQKAGEPHAEIFALDEAGEQSKGATVYVTLEPCSFTGRTGPCCDALIEAGVARVVCAMQDPNPKVAGQGIERIRKAGIDVGVGLLEDQAESLNKGFIKRMKEGIPFVRLKAASSLDGRSAMASGESQWITSEASRNDAQRLRAESCAIVTGIDTLLIDNPRYTVREESLGQGVKRQPELWVCDSRLRIDLELSALKQIDKLGRVIVIATTQSAIDSQQDKVDQLHKLGAVVLACDVGLDEAGAGRLDLKQLMVAMNNRQINEVLVESGPTLTASFLSEMLIDEIVWYVAPKVLGADAKPVFDLSFDSLVDTMQMSITSLKSCGPDIKLVLNPE